MDHPDQSQPSHSRRPKAKTKTYAGCWICRSRRIQCDEVRPTCQACAADGVTCGGYSARLQWLSPRTIDKPNAVEKTTLVPRSRRLMLGSGTYIFVSITTLSIMNIDGPKAKLDLDEIESSHAQIEALPAKK
ncbi:hypothetical protein ACJZ2D_000679 [Fusarium nematophilum]